MGTVGPLPMVASCQIAMNKAKMAIETNVARKVSERVMARTGAACAICCTPLNAGASAKGRKSSPQGSLPPKPVADGRERPCVGGGTGRGVAANSEFGNTPLPIPPPQGGREECVARTSPYGEECVCGNGRKNNE